MLASRRLGWLLAPLTIAALACGGEGTATPEDDGAGNAGSGAGATSGGGGAGQGGGGAGEGAGSPADYHLGMVVIDVQETFVDYAANQDMSGIIARTKTSFELAGARDLPFFLTYEASKSGDHALHAPLQGSVPSQGAEFIKTTFAATGLPAFRDAVLASAVSHVVVMGAETDVCVLQTALGLRAMGLGVLLQHDAVFSSEPNVPPALRRMEQAGITLVSEAELAHFVDAPEDLPAPPEAPPSLVAPLTMGVVLHAFDDASLSASGDPLKTQKSARLRELLMVSEWFDRPVYVADPNAGLPSAYSSYYGGALRPLSQIASDGEVKQLVFAGTDGDLPALLQSYVASHDLFVMEDALLASDTAAAQSAALQPFFDQGMVPLTYKTFYYDMTKSVSLSEWPSQSWVDKYDEFYWITQAPEDLPPIQP
ncbi:MAG: isochorismatase family protein [Polyangiaceae bacterium]